MTASHKNIYILQFLLYALIIGSFAFLKPGAGQSVFLFLSVFISELMLVFRQSEMNQSEVYYKKSCLFALGDLTAAFTYCGYFIFFILAWISGDDFHYLIWPLILLFGYTFLRKIFIFKNYTYEIK